MMTMYVANREAASSAGQSDNSAGRCVYLLVSCDPGDVGPSGFPNRPGSYDVYVTADRDRLETLYRMYEGACYEVREKNIFWEPCSGRITPVETDVAEEIIEFNRSMFRHVYFSFERLWSLANLNEEALFETDEYAQLVSPPARRWVIQR